MDNKTENQQEYRRLNGIVNQPDLSDTYRTATQLEQKTHPLSTRNIPQNILDARPQTSLNKRNRTETIQSTFSNQNAIRNQQQKEIWKMHCYLWIKHIILNNSWVTEEIERE